MLKFISMFLLHEVIDFFLRKWLFEGEYVRNATLKITGIQLA